MSQKLKQQQNSSMNHKLDSIKQLFSQILSLIVKQNSETRYDNNSTKSSHNKLDLNFLHKGCSPQPSNLKRIDLQKQYSVLFYEVKLLTTLLSRLQIDEDNHIFKINQRNFNEQIQKMEQENDKTQKNRNLSQKLKVQNKKNVQLLIKAQKQKQMLSKKLKIHEKVVSQIQKIGGISVFTQLKDQIRQMSGQLQKQIKQKNTLKQQVKQMKCKCKILQQLNKNTEQKLSQALVNCKADLSSKHQKQNFSANCLQNISVQMKSKDKVQILALKQQIRQLKQTIQGLKKQNQNLRSRHASKENIYQKMIMKNSKIL